MALTDTQIRNAKPSSSPKKLSDGGGLHLRVAPGGGKLWRVSYRFMGKQKTVALGVYPEVTLSMARERLAETKKLLAVGRDPAVQAKLAKITRAVTATNTFNVVADEFLAKYEREGRAERGKHRPSDQKAILHAPRKVQIEPDSLHRPIRLDKTA